MRRKLANLCSQILRRSKEVQIKVHRPQGTLRIPLLLGLFGTAAFPRLVSWGALALLLARCSLEIERR